MEIPSDFENDIILLAIEFLNVHKGYSINEICDALKLNRSSYYKWKKRKQCKSELLNIQIKKKEPLGAMCAERQASGTSKMKDLLSGLDVLCSFGRINLFMTGINEASNQVEEPKYHLTWVKNLAQDGMPMVLIIAL